MDKSNLPHDHGQDVGRLLSVLPDLVSFQRVAETFQLISDSTRLRIFWLLCHSELCVYNIAAAVDMSPPAVSHHLKMLRNAGLIINRRIGKEIHYALADTAEAGLVHRIADEMFSMKCPTGG
ncbi:MAG: metalloregulator ArsR/SmtB family transcription factor [Clostridiales bacterium]|nr:metalloregulator ArsR/SmtB family transcription factor [Clostridiales bacterium]